MSKSVHRRHRSRTRFQDPRKAAEARAARARRKRKAGSWPSVAECPVCGFRVVGPPGMDVVAEGCDNMCGPLVKLA